MLLGIEERAFRAWPAEEVYPLNGWRLRFMRGVTRRANSVWANDAWGVATLEERLEAVELFYRRRGLRALYQVTAVSRPQGLDAVLAGRGYQIEAPVSVQHVRTDLVLESPRPEIVVRVEERLSDGWFDLSAHQGRFAMTAEIYRGLLDRLAGRALFALAEVDGQPAAVGMGVADAGWLGIFSMHTLPDFRRRGLGSAVVRALAEGARERGLEDLYLQVELENEAARSLYERLGFRETYRYHYRRGP